MCHYDSVIAITLIKNTAGVLLGPDKINNVEELKPIMLGGM